METVGLVTEQRWTSLRIRRSRRRKAGAGGCGDGEEIRVGELQLESRMARVPPTGDDTGNAEQEDILFCDAERDSERVIAAANESDTEIFINKQPHRLRIECFFATLLPSLKSAIVICPDLLS